MSDSAQTIADLHAIAWDAAVKGAVGNRLPGSQLDFRDRVLAGQKPCSAHGSGWRRTWQPHLKCSRNPRRSFSPRWTRRPTVATELDVYRDVELIRAALGFPTPAQQLGKLREEMAELEEALSESAATPDRCVAQDAAFEAADVAITALGVILALDFDPQTMVDVKAYEALRKIMNQKNEATS